MSLPIGSIFLNGPRLPDAGVSVDTLRDDIANMSAVGAGGFEFIPFYMYGLVGSAYGPDSWAEDGYGTPKYKSIFTTAAQAAKDNGLVMDFAIGPNQGQGAPAAPETHGLAVELVSLAEHHRLTTGPITFGFSP
jgi:hypothetical protein